MSLPGAAISAGCWGILLAATALVICYLHLRRGLNSIRSLWDDIYFRLRDRCQLVGELSLHLRRLLRNDLKLVNDIEYLLGRIQNTCDPRIHAAVQNGLVLTVQTAVEQFHRGDDIGADPALCRTMEAIRVVDSRLAPMRDRFNRLIEMYNTRVKTWPLCIVARVWGLTERPSFPMLIPWWSTDAAAYGAVTADDIRRQLRARRAPLVLAPSFRLESGETAPVIRVRANSGRSSRSATGCQARSHG